jgi:hypothetical protein
LVEKPGSDDMSFACPCGYSGTLAKRGKRYLLEVVWHIRAVLPDLATAKEALRQSREEHVCAHKLGRTQ